MNKVRSYKDLNIWNRGMAIAGQIYEITKKFPDDERFGLVTQMRRAAVSIPSNIAEGKMKGTDPEFKRSLFIAFGSGAELETQLEIAKNNKFVSEEKYKATIELLTEIMRMLNALIKKLTQ